MAFLLTALFPDEDAYITYVFSKNLLEGHGLTYNGIRVEGYTNLMTVLLTAGMAGLTGLPVDAAGMWYALATFLLSVGTFHFLVYRAQAAHSCTSDAALTALAASIVLLLHPAFLYWGTSGMENTLYVLVTLSALHGIHTRQCALPLVCAALLPLVRYDGILPAALLGIWVVVADLAERRAGGWHRMPTYALWGALVLLPFALSMVYRMAYYGDTVPHTAYEKFFVRNPSDRLVEGAAYLWNFLWGSHALWMLTAIALFSAAKRFYWGRLQWASLALFVLTCAQLVYVGGDVEWKPHSRFGTLPLALLLLLLFSGVRFKRVVASPILAALVFLVVSFVIPLKEPGPVSGLYTQHFNFQYRLGRNYIWQRLSNPAAAFRLAKGNIASLGGEVRDDDFSATGKLIAAIAKPEDRLITTLAGKLVYEAGIPAVDMTSLASEHIWRELKIGERQRLGATCRFAVFLNKDSFPAYLLHPKTSKRLCAIVDMPEHYHDLTCLVFAEGEILDWPDTLPGQEPLTRFPIKLDGEVIQLYRPTYKAERDFAAIEKMYRTFAAKGAK